MNKKWYNIPDQTKRNAYIQISETTGIAPFAVEKDWWVIQALSGLFSMKVGEHFIFKGGTSLSKAWGIIDRFSEDIDIVFNRNFLGYSGYLNRSQIKKLRKITGQFISEELNPILENILKEGGLSDIRINRLKQNSSDADPVQIEILYPNVMNYPGYVKPRVLVEISCSSLMEPFKVQSFASFLDQHYFESEFADDPVDIPTVIPERTFLEKIFLLHEEMQRPKERIRVEQQSRHLYDIYQIIENTNFAINALNNKELYETIVNHRYRFNRIGGIDYNLHQPQTISPLPVQDIRKAWRDDYNKMQEEMIYGDSPDFDVIIASIKYFTENKINHLPWKIELSFD